VVSGLTMHIPAYLRYDLRATDGQWAIAQLRAYWELPTMVLQMLRQGAKSLPASMHLTRGLLRHQGLSGTAGFLSGFRSAGRRGKKLVEAFLVDQRPGASWGKLIAAGDTVVASITTPKGRGVLFCEIDRAAMAISSTRYFSGVTP
jgi:hypothetical protein